MTRRNFLAALGATAAAQPKSKPNVVIILADDLGHGDLSCYGNKHVETVHCDRLAKEGRRFYNAYTPSSVCSPTRYALMTGRYCWRTSLKRQVLSVGAPLHIEPSRMTLASMFRKHGYEGAAIGKWHLGYGADAKVDWNKPLKPGPLELGFTYHFGVPSNHGDLTRAFIENYDVVGRTPGVPFELGVKGEVPKGLAQPRVDDRVNITLAEKAVAFIERSKDKPFFLYFTPVGVHNPVTPNKMFRGKSKAGLYGDYILETDYCVGQVLSALDRHNLAKNTIVIFSSDNGAVVPSYSGRRETATFNLILENDDGGAVKNHYSVAQAEAEDAGHKPVGPLRGRKHSVYEGGFRVPFLVRWPGQVKPNSSSNEVVQLADMLATFAGIMNEKIPPGNGEDSYDIRPALFKDKLAKPIREATVVHNADGVFAIRQGQWKMIEKLTDPTGLARAWGKEGAETHLYDLAADPYEETDLASKRPEVVERLTKLLNTYRDRGWSARAIL
ncbi:MAG: arylsulfatase [Acidobacteria bacterium]|nr:arylsulfatase [Acidobacteriota bacterium]